MDLSFPCPHCGAPARALSGAEALAVVGMDDDVVLHATPVCETYDELDALEFMKSCNDVLAGGKEKADEVRMSDEARRTLDLCEMILVVPGEHGMGDQTHCQEPYIGVTTDGVRVCERHAKLLEAEEVASVIARGKERTR